MRPDSSIFSKIRYGIILLCIAATGQSVRAAENALRPDETIRVSLVTAGPGKEVYQLEGHTALRMRKDIADTLAAGGMRTVYDLAVNWGVFDFDSPNFIYRFVKGETDYMALAYPFELFLEEYRHEGRRVVEQELNLTPNEAQKLELLVGTNLMPENRTYRYNYVKDNCATRPLAIVENAIGDTITFDPAAFMNEYLPGDSGFPRTFRKDMTDYHRNYPWYQFGIDLALGSGIDYEITPRERTFAPVYLEKELARATRIMPDGNREPFVKSSRIIVEGAEKGVQEKATPWPLTPFALAVDLLLLTAIISFFDWRRKRLTRWLDTVLYGAFFLCGCLLTFLIFVSVHEATSPNWLYLWLNPLCIIPAVGIWIKRCKRVVYCYQICNFAALILLLAGHSFFGQALNMAFPLLILCDLIRSATQIYILGGKRGIHNRNTK